MSDAVRSEGLRLAQPEDEHARAEWEAAAATVLRKAGRLADQDPDEAVWGALTRTTLDGIAVPPLGLPDPVAATQPGPRPTRAGAWDIRALVAAAGSRDAKLVNEEALVDLDGGVTSLWVHADAATDLRAVLAGVLLDLAPVVLEAPTAALAVGRSFLDLASGTDLHPDTNLGADPLGALLRGSGTEQRADDLSELAVLARAAGVRSIVVDATAAHDLGASDAQELGWSLAVGVAYLRVLTDHGLSIEDAADQIEFRYAATDEQFATIAKLRAARRAWAGVLAHCGVGGSTGPGVTTRIHATTSRPMLSKYDPYVNMLRGTVAAFAAGVGGADAVTVLPFDAANGRPEAFGRRIARNVSHLLIDESHVAVVADPAGGAYAVERLTTDLATAGWAEFQRLEAEWSVASDADAAARFDAFRARVDAVVAEREQQIAHRKRPITGLSEFPNLAESLPVREPDPLADGVRRYGASFEAMRDEHPAEPVFLATLGPVAQHTARATFAANLLAAGGIQVDSAGATTGPADLVAAYRGQKVAVLAGADAAYGEWGQAAAEALRAAGASRIVIAGKPVPYADDSAAMGLDALAFLDRTRKALA